MSRLPWKPIKLPFGQLDQRLDEEFARLLLSPWEQSPLANWQPQIDVLETATEYVIEADLPGVMPDHLTVEAESDGITICGHRSQSSVAATHRGIWTERHQGQFCRHFRLDNPIDAKQIRIEHVHGVYRIHLPKRADPRASV